MQSLLSLMQRIMSWGEGVQGEETFKMVETQIRKIANRQYLPVNLIQIPCSFYVVKTFKQTFLLRQLMGYFCRARVFCLKHWEKRELYCYSFMILLLYGNPTKKRNASKSLLNFNEGLLLFCVLQCARNAFVWTVFPI